MWPYLLLFLVFALPSLLQGRAKLGDDVKTRTGWWMAYLFLVMMIGLRFEVGGDWRAYLTYVADSSDMNFSDVLVSTEPAYMLLNWITSRLGLGVYAVNLLSAAIFSYGLIVFARKQPRPMLAILIAVPYLITVVAMGYTRQSISIGLIMLAFVALSDKRMHRFFVLMVIAALFHRSAIIIIPIVAFVSAGRTWQRYALIAITLTLLYYLTLQGAEQYYREGYIDAGYSSQGALMRIMMNALPAIIFILLRRHFQLSPQDRKFWLTFAFAALAFIPLLQLSPSSTAVDRLALYFIPIQMFVLSRLPEALGQKDGANFGWVFMIILYSASVLLVWLLFAEHARYWLPYKFYPWEWIWDFPYDSETASEW